MARKKKEVPCCADFFMMQMEALSRFYREKRVPHSIHRGTLLGVTHC